MCIFWGFSCRDPPPTGALPVRGPVSSPRGLVILHEETRGFRVLGVYHGGTSPPPKTPPLESFCTCPLSPSGLHDLLRHDDVAQVVDLALDPGLLATTTLLPSLKASD